MKKILEFIVLFALAFVADAEYQSMPLIHSPAGTYLGSVLKTRKGNDIFSFRGIRYALPPTGANRFQQATIVQPHAGIYHATKDGPLCPQPPIPTRTIIEDCLVLNIYTNKLPEVSVENTELNKTARPVLVFFHDVDFARSSGSSYDLHPKNLLDVDLILVTMNYRLGVTGFLSSGDAKAPGNAGLKDQVLALRWIQRNIEAFGGDPNKVTLSGHQTGAWCVSLHLVSPMSRGLFHGAIIFDGTAPFHQTLPNNQLDLAKKIAKNLNCPVDNSDVMFDCFCGKSSLELGNAASNFTDLGIYSLPAFGPVIEQTYHGNDNYEAFLTEHPLNIIRQRTTRFVPLISGFDKVQFGNLSIYEYNRDPNSFRENVRHFEEHWAENAPKLFGYDRDARSSIISRELTSFYLKNQPITAGNDDGLGELYDDAITIFPIHRVSQLLAAYSNEPVYKFYNIYKGCGGFWKWSNGTHFSPSHYNQLRLLFGIGSHPDLCKRDAEISAHLVGMIINFMETGNPTPDNSAVSYPVKWRSSTANHPQYLEFDKTMQMVDGFIVSDRMKKWDELFPY